MLRKKCTLSVKPSWCTLVSLTILLSCDDEQDAGISLHAIFYNS
ncbi:hypothetical protein KC19_5G130200 [Ceratodon purpureus]|uniref:Lipoprotein n=1 Tax=Ceratodon purpureus TaxID=3225 RepID=A0A8T0I0W8_CERPU|nr:hypothetical protein KC19_5G130200 [Ceratodon purpureus]